MYRKILFILLLPVFCYSQRTGFQFPLSTQTVAWENVLSTIPACNTTYAVNRWCIGTFNDGDFQLLDRFWLFGQDNQTNAGISIPNPSSTAVTAVNSCAWNFLNYHGNGTSSYVNLNFTPSTQGVNFTQNSASFGLYTNSTGGLVDNMWEIGGEDGSHWNVLICRDNQTTPSNQTATDINDNGGGLNTTGDIGAVGGVYSVVRTSSTTSSIWNRGVQAISGTNASNGVTSKSIYACASNMNGTAGQFSIRQISLVFFGGGGINQLNFWNRTQSLAFEMGFGL